MPYEMSFVLNFTIGEHHLPTGKTQTYQVDPQLSKFRFYSEGSEFPLKKTTAKLELRIFNSKLQEQCAKSSGFHNSCKKQGKNWFQI